MIWLIEKLGLPVHPLIVHFPVALGLVMPFLVLGVHIFIRKGWFPHRTWWIVIGLNLMLWMSSGLATKTGEWDSERVGQAVGKQLVHDHEEWGEKVMWVSLTLLVVAVVANFVRFPWLKTVHLLGSIGLLVLVILAGHSGASLVYKSGACTVSGGKPPVN